MYNLTSLFHLELLEEEYKPFFTFFYMMRHLCLLRTSINVKTTYDDHELSACYPHVQWHIMNLLFLLNVVI